MQQHNYFAGRDGFVWWFGVVEDRSDPKSLGRVRVRVFGYHTDDKTKLPTYDLPWAYCIQPSNSASSGGIGSSPTGPIEGTWVIGFWRDPDFYQEPMVFGTLPGINGANAAPSGQSPHDFSEEQQLDPPQTKSATVVSSGTQTAFATPQDTTDAVVMVKINGVVQSPNNLSPASPNNVEVPDDDYYGGGTQYSGADFSPSRYATKIASMVNQITPELRERFANGTKNFLAKHHANGLDCSIGFAYRSLSTQASLYKKYKSGGPKAASPGFSWHNYAVAIDFQIFTDNGQRYDTGTSGGSNYTDLARAAFTPYGLVNEIANDIGHFYPSAFGKSPPVAVRNGTKTVAAFAAEKGLA
jgi:hypothetical protein